MFHRGAVCRWQHLRHANPHKTASPQHICLTNLRKTSLVQKLIPAAFKPPEINTDRVKNITEAIGIYISTSVRPCAIVENPGFRYLLKVLELRYSVPSHVHISSLWSLPFTSVHEHELSTAQAVALTTDGWTSRCTESYLTVNAHFITSEWEMKNTVFLTRTEQHISTVSWESTRGSNRVESWKAQNHSSNHRQFKKHC